MPATEQLLTGEMAEVWLESWREALREGYEEGRWMGRIQLLQEFLGKPISPSESLEALTLEQLEALYRELRSEYETRFGQA